MPSEVPEVMTLAQASAYLQLHHQTLRKFVRSGVIPAAKIGRQWRLHKVELDQFLRRQYRTRQGAFELVPEDEQ